MASSGRDATPPEDEARHRDAAWITLTEGMEPYERFRYIVRHVLEAAVEDARSYADDERLFDVDADDVDASRQHLRELESRVEDDPELTDAERAFLCEVVGMALRERGLEARCYGGLLDRGPGEDCA